ncbi:MAG: UbiA family prenyltransferase [Candidatus Diapherotrites archaeon]|nr:UbiA family prenyltransferase [Candidatus Diapherotrites archaeon]
MNLKFILDAIITLNIYLSFGIALTALAFGFLISGKLDVGLFLIVFLPTWSLYLLNRITDKEEDLINKPERKNIIETYNKTIICVIVITYLLAILLALRTNINLFFLLLIILFIGIIYSVKITKLKKIIGYYRLKQIFLIKNITIAIDWALATAIIPVLYYNLPINIQSIVLATFLFIRSNINTIVFDIPDVEGDRKHKVMTIPVKLGVEKTIYWMYILNTISLILIIFSVLIGILPNLAYGLLIGPMMGYAFLYLLDKPNTISTKNLLDWIVDGEFLITGMFIILLGIF